MNNNNEYPTYSIHYLHALHPFILYVMIYDY